VLCNFGETNYLGTEKGPRMLLLDSLKESKPMGLRTDINRFDPFIVTLPKPREFLFT
jgi:hypothetical protein